MVLANAGESAGVDDLIAGCVIQVGNQIADRQAFEAVSRRMLEGRVDDRRPCLLTLSHRRIPSK